MKKESKFGLDVLDSKKKAKEVHDIFASVANNYDLMNDLMSLGLHRLWKERFYQMAKVKSNDIVIDIASGTGDIAINIAKKIKNIDITCLDANKNMLEICKNRTIDLGFIKNFSFIQSQIENFKKKDKFSLATLAFGLRNFTDLELGLSNIFSSLKVGGRLIIMDFKSPDNKFNKKLYELYTDNVLPKLGEIISGDQKSYQYLSDSIKTYITPEELSVLMSEVGYSKIRSEILPGDIVSIHIGYKT